MGEQDPQNVGFLGLNVVVVGVMVLVAFGYLLFLVRKRWRDRFLHVGKRKRPT